MKTLKSLYLVPLLALCHAPLLQADATITVLSPSQPDTTVYTKNGLVRIDFSDPESGDEGYMLFNSRNNDMIMVDTKNRRKMDMGEQAMEQQMDTMKSYQSQMMTMMEENIKNLPPEQQRMIREQMSGNAMTPPAAATAKEPTKARIVKVGDGKSGKYACTRYEAFQGSTKTAEACFASAGELDLAKSDYEAIKAMFRHTQKMQQKAQSMVGPYGGDMEDTGFTGDEADGLPVSMKNLRTGDETTISEVSDKKLADDLFVIPDYPSMEMGMPE